MALGTIRMAPRRERVSSISIVRWPDGYLRGGWGWGSGHAIRGVMVPSLLSLLTCMGGMTERARGQWELLSSLFWLACWLRFIRCRSAADAVIGAEVRGSWCESAWGAVPWRCKIPAEWKCGALMMGGKTTRALFFLVPRSAWSIGRRNHCSILHHRRTNLFVDPGEFLVILRLLGKIPLTL